MREEALKLSHFFLTQTLISSDSDTDNVSTLQIDSPKGKIQIDEDNGKNDCTFTITQISFYC